MIRNLLIEGCLLASFAMGANACYIYLRGEYIAEAHRLCSAPWTKLMKQS